MEITEITWMSDWLNKYDAETTIRLTGYSIITVLLVYIINSLLLGIIFKKAGRKWWEAWIPVLRDWSFFKIGGFRGTNIFWNIAAAFALCTAGMFSNANMTIPAFCISLAALCLAIVYIVYKIASMLSIQKKLNKPGVFVVLWFINLIAPLWMWILALDNSKYNKKAGRVSR